MIQGGQGFGLDDHRTTSHRSLPAILDDIHARPFAAQHLTHSPNIAWRHQRARAEGL